ncbi:unnamed protein product [Euphydryas editha]|uniref:Transcription factor cwo n=1 Tax=Euphydryas editha TaxID=104508 RepID=A0AAU9V6M6_EUPED|nr:unnamed protein product [Euphydryas editha]
MKARARGTQKREDYNTNDDFGRAGGLNFAAPSEDEADYPPGAYLKKGKQDPMSHRIIEKRRRDRMNNCLADLSRLIPPEYLKKGRGRVEKTEIIEMAIRHLKFLQDRFNAERSGDEYRAGFQEAATEAVRFLVEVQGFGPGDGLCLQLASHLQRHCEVVTKIPRDKPREKTRSHASSSETASSSNSSHGYAVKVIQRPDPPPFPEPYEDRPEPYPMECDRVSALPAAEADAPLDGPLKREPALRKVRKPEHTDDYLHSYKFKNSIERRFSRSQDSENEPQYQSSARCVAQATDGAARGAAHGKVYTHKRRRAAKPPAPASTSASASTDANDTSPQDTSSDSPHHHQYDKPPPPTQYVPVFALNSLGKYYVPLSVEYACVARQLGALEADSRPLAALHPVTIHVNFQPCINYHVKREPADHWRPG